MHSLHSVPGSSLSYQFNNRIVKNTKRSLAVAILIFVLLIPQTGSASFEKSFASVGFSLFSAIGASVDTVTDVTNKTARLALVLTKQAENLIQQTHRVLRRSVATGKHLVREQFANVKNNFTQHSMLEIPNKIRHFVANITKGFKELGKVELVFSEKQETRSLAKAEITPSNPPYFKGEDNETIRYVKNADNQPLKIIERIIVKEVNQESGIKNHANDQKSMFHDSNLMIQDPRINSLVTNLADLTSRVDERYGISSNLGGAYSNSALFNMIAQSQRIKTLDDVKITNATIEGYVTGTTLSNYLPLGGGHTHRRIDRNHAHALKLFNRNLSFSVFGA